MTTDPLPNPTADHLQRLAADPSQPYVGYEVEALESHLTAVEKLRARVEEAPAELRTEGFWRAVADRLQALLVPNVPTQAIAQLTRDLQAGYDAGKGPLPSQPHVDPFERGRLEQAQLTRIDERIVAIDRELRVAEPNLNQSRGGAQDERLAARVAKLRMEQGLLKAARPRILRAFAAPDPVREVLEALERTTDTLLDPAASNDRRREQLAVLDDLSAQARGAAPAAKRGPRRPV